MEKRLLEKALMNVFSQASGCQTGNAAMLSASPFSPPSLKSDLRIAFRAILPYKSSNLPMF